MEETKDLQDLQAQMGESLDLIVKGKTLPADEEGSTTTEDCTAYPPGSPCRDISILLAAQEGDMETVLRLLENGANVRQRNQLGDTVLHIAARGGHQRVIVVLLGFGAKVDVVGPQRRRPVHLAAAAGHLGAVQRLLTADANANVKDADSRTPLMLAARHGHSQIVSLLLSHKVSTSGQDDNGDTALIMAVKGRHLNVVEVMGWIGHLDEIGADRYSAMTHAAKIGAWDIVKLLCEMGASARVYYNVKNSPLPIAAEKGDVDTVTYLLDFGGEFNSEEEMVALSLARDLSVVWAFEDALPGIIHKEIGEGAMRLAAKCGRLHAMVAMLNAGVYIDAIDKQNRSRTALINACEFGQTECVKILLERGADYGHREQGCVTALHHASANGHEQIVRILLQAGANNLATNKSGKTPLGLAKTVPVKKLLENVPTI